MAIQRSIFPLIGTIGGVTFFQRRGEFFARRATSLNKNRIMTDPAFARTRENAMEFSGCAKASKSISLGLSNLRRTMFDKTAVNRLIQKIKKINLKGTGSRGERSIDITDNPNMLLGFDFVKEEPFSSVFGGTYTVEESVGRDSSTVTISAFNPANLLKVPQNATHFRFVNALTVVSDYVYDDEMKAYQPADADLDGLNTLQYSAYMPVDEAVLADLDIIALFAGTPVISVDVAVVNCLGVEFSQEINGEHFVFAQNNAMKIVKIF